MFIVGCAVALTQYHLHGCVRVGEEGGGGGGEAMHPTSNMTFRPATSTGAILEAMSMMACLLSLFMALKPCAAPATTRPIFHWLFPETDKQSGGGGGGHRKWWARCS